jgi:hypothetical protein
MRERQESSCLCVLNSWPIALTPGARAGSYDAPSGSFRTCRSSSLKSPSSNMILTSFEDGFILTYRLEGEGEQTAVLPLGRYDLDNQFAK